MEIDKNRLILEKNALVAKCKELRREIAAFQQNIVFQQTTSLLLPRSSNQRTEETAFIFGRDKLKTYILDTFDRTKRIFRRFLIQMKVYHQFYTISLLYLNNKI